MIILGIDPGTRRMGYGLIKKTGREIELVDAGIVKTEAKDNPGVLLEIKRGLSAILRKFKPEIVAVEKVFFSKNQKTAMQIAEARGVALALAAERGLPVREYAPNEAKLALTGYGSADKKAVLKMVRLALKTPKLNIIDDASDALALAIIAADKNQKHSGR